MKPDRIKYGRNISPETEAFLTNVGPALLSEFLHRYQNGKVSLRGRHYETERDHTWRSAESKIYDDRMVES